MVVVKYVGVPTDVRWILEKTRRVSFNCVFNGSLQPNLYMDC